MTINYSVPIKRIAAAKLHVSYMQPETKITQQREIVRIASPIEAGHGIHHVLSQPVPVLVKLSFPQQQIVIVERSNGLASRLEPLVSEVAVEVENAEQG